MLIYNINMKLTKQDIQFIDKYLKESGVKYVDIRYEMTDHVATALEGMEGSFYESFKSYMLQHKKELLNSNSKFTKAAGKRAIKIMLQNILKPLTVVVFIVFFTALTIIVNYFSQIQALEVYSQIYVLLMLSVILYYKYFSTRYHKYSIIDKLKAIMFTTLYIVFVLVRPEGLIDDVNVIITYYSLLSAFFVSSFIGYKTLVDKYKLQYND